MQRWYHENSREFTGSYWALKGHPASSQGGSPGSSPLRTDGSRDDQAGEAGPVEHSSAEAKSLKTRGQETVRLPPQWATTEAARWKARGQIKDNSHDNFRKNTELKAALTGSTVRQKAKEGRRLFYAPILKLQKGMAL